MSTPGNSARTNPATRLDAARRAAEFADLRERGTDRPVDLVVIGGGITGVGIALDAAARGLDTVLVDAHDLAFGTSRWSSKLVHGGLRYLATGNVGIAHRSAVERGVLMEHTAPHLTRALPQIVPVFRDTPVLGKFLPRLGFVAGDMLRKLAGTAVATLPRSRTISATAVAAYAPTVRRDGLLGGYLNWDGQLVDDARLVVAVARTAAGLGARILTHVRAAEASGDGVTLTDTRDGASFRLGARAVVNATGVWAGEVDSSLRLRPSRGTHLVFDAALFGNPTGALTVPVPGSANRFCFVMPEQHGRVYLGLTDEDCPGPVPDVPEVPEEDIDFLLDVINRGLGTRVTRADIRGAFAGLRPLVDTGDGHTADISREHAILTAPNGLVSIIGGKLTEYRLMAEQVLDQVVRDRGLGGAPCSTRQIALVGAPAHPDSAGITQADLIGLPGALVERFGHEAPAVVAACPLERPLDPIAPGMDITRAEFAFHVTHEGALDEADIVDRRSRIGLVSADREAALPAAAEAVALIAG